MTLDIAEIVQTFLKGFYLGVLLRRAVEEYSEVPDVSCLLLRVHHAGPSSRRTNNHRNELATLHLHQPKEHPSCYC